METFLEQIECVQHKRQLFEVLACAEDEQVKLLIKLVHTIAHEKAFRPMLTSSQKNNLSLFVGKTYKRILKAPRRVQVNQLLSLGMALKRLITFNIDRKWLTNILWPKL